MSAELRFWQAERKCFRVLSDYLHLLERWETAYAPKSPGDGWNPLFVEAMQKREYVGYLLDTLLAGTKEEKAAVITGHRRWNGLRGLSRSPPMNTGITLSVIT